jgi:ADP-heptose:LPS heptosyltransferase
MSLCKNVEASIHDCRSKIEILDHSISEEMRRNHKDRRYKLLYFLYSEKKAYAMALSKLNSTFQESIDRGTERPIPVFEPERFIGDSNGLRSKVERTSIDRRTYRIVTWGGIGDVLLITPTLRKLKQCYPESRVHVYCINRSHGEVLRNNKYIDRLTVLGALRRNIYYLVGNLLKSVEIQSPNYGRLIPSLFYQKKAAEIIGEMIGVEIDNPRPDCFLTESEEIEGRNTISKYPNPVVIHVTGKSTQNKNWLVKNWEALVLNNPFYNYLQIGMADEEPVRGAVDLRGTTSLRQAFAIIKAANAFIGVDSVFAHVATAFQRPAVVLFGATTPAVWGYDVNQNLYSAPHCSPCIDILQYDPCPYERQCMSNITVSDVEKAFSVAMMRAAERQE